jgi:predicted MFS family arabinose efflux permease
VGRGTVARVMSGRFGSHFRAVFLASLLQELSFSLMLHFPGYAEQLGATESRIGLLYSSAAVAALVGRPAFGRVLDLVARRSVLLVTGLANAIVLFGLITTDEWGPQLWGLFLVQRILQIFLFTAMLTVAADLLPAESRTRGLALFGLSGLVPIAVGGALGGFVVETFDFDVLFLLAGACAVGSWLLVWRLPMLVDHGERPRRGFWAALAQPDLLPLWLVTFCFALGLEAIFAFLAVFVEAEDVGSAGVFFALYGGTGVVTRLAGRGLYERVAPRPFVTAALFGYAAGLSILATGTSAGLAIAAVVCGVAHGAVFPMLSSQVVARARSAERGSAMATFTALFDIALLVGAPAAGFMIEARGYGPSFLSLAAVQAVGAVVYAAWDRKPVAPPTSVPSAP